MGRKNYPVAHHETQVASQAVASVWRQVRAVGAGVRGRCRDSGHCTGSESVCGCRYSSRLVRHSAVDPVWIDRHRHACFDTRRLHPNTVRKLLTCAKCHWRHQALHEGGQGLLCEPASTLDSGEHPESWRRRPVASRGVTSLLVKGRTGPGSYPLSQRITGAKQVGLESGAPLLFFDFFQGFAVDA